MEVAICCLVLCCSNEAEDAKQVALQTMTLK